MTNPFPTDGLNIFKHHWSVIGPFLQFLKEFQCYDSVHNCKQEFNCRQETNQKNLGFYFTN